MLAVEWRTRGSMEMAAGTRKHYRPTACIWCFSIVRRIRMKREISSIACLRPTTRNKRWRRVAVKKWRPQLSCACVWNEKGSSRNMADSTCTANQRGGATVCRSLQTLVLVHIQFICIALFSCITYTQSSVSTVLLQPFNSAV